MEIEKLKEIVMAEHDIYLAHHQEVNSHTIYRCSKYITDERAKELIEQLHGKNGTGIHKEDKKIYMIDLFKLPEKTMVMTTIITNVEF